MLLALREHEAAQEALCLLLEWQIVQSDDQRVQIATTLQSTPTGRANYLALCGRQLHLQELVSLITHLKFLQLHAQVPTSHEEGEKGRREKMVNSLRKSLILLSFLLETVYIRVHTLFFFSVKKKKCRR